MRALVFERSSASLTQRPAPDVPEGWSLVRLHMAGVCNTDLEILKGYMAFEGILGHEMVGTVVRGPDPWPGKRVVADINFACGSCEACARGLGRHCPNRTVMGIAGAAGAFADLVAVPTRNLHEVPASVPDEAAVFCEPLAAAFEILEQVHLTSHTSVLVLGDGKLGLLVAQVMFQAGCDLLALGKHPEKLAILSRRGIPACTLDAWNGRKVDVVVDATGSVEGFQHALRAVRPRGTLVLKSTVAEPFKLDLAPVVINELTITGSRCGTFQPALRALQSNSVDVTSLIGHVLPFERAEEALRLAASPGALKVLMDWR